MADDIVTRLAEEIDSLKADPQVLRDAIVEIERLRAAGDALVPGNLCECYSCAKARKAWQEARREQ